MSSCGECINADFELTPKGRIKRNLSGRCLLEKQIIEDVNNAKAAPCVSRWHVYGVGIWPDYNAINCLNSNENDIMDLDNYISRWVHSYYFDAL